jgi:putative acyl-CoA dehydrogenase
MSDGFLTLAQTEAGLSCFLVPRWLPDGTRNAIHLMRLKDKLGNRANASAEIEYHGALAHLVGEEGRGIPAILTMVHHTRLDTAMAPAGPDARRARHLGHWVTHRTAFQRRLIDQPLMRSSWPISCSTGRARGARLPRRAGLRRSRPRALRPDRRGAGQIPQQRLPPA